MTKKNIPQNVSQKPSSLSGEIQLIKQKTEKIGLYLNLLEQDLISMQSLAAYKVSQEINDEIKDFILTRLKESTGTGSSEGFSNAEVTVLKMLANKALGAATAKPVAPPSLPVTARFNKIAPIIKQEDLEQQELLVVDSSDSEDEEFEEEEEEPAPRPIKKPIAKKKKKVDPNQAHIDAHLVKKNVIVRHLDGSETEEVSITHKTVLPPAHLKRIPFPTFDQQLMNARAVVQPASQQVAQLQQIPMAGSQGFADTSED